MERCRELAETRSEWHLDRMDALAGALWAPPLRRGAAAEGNDVPWARQLAPALPRRSVRAVCAALGTVALLGAALGGTGCPRGGGELSRLPVVTTDDPNAEADLRAARRAAEQDRPAEARSRYEAFLEEYPDDPLVPVAKVRLGRLLLAEGDSERALQLFEDVSGHDDDSLADRARFYRGVGLHLAGDHGASLEALRRFVGRTVDPEDTALLLQTIAAASLHLEDRRGAIEALDELASASVPERERDDARERLAELIDGLDDPEELQQLYERLPHDGPGWPRVARRALRQSFQQGEMERVREIATALREEHIELGEELQAMVLRAERSGQAQPQTIGAVLPLSGRGREVGQRALQGLMLAAELPPDGPVAPDAPQIVFRDSAGEPDRAVKAVEELVSLHRVIAIVGPVEGRAARSAAARAQELGVPLIALSAADGLTEVGPMIFRHFMTRHGEVRELVAAARAREVERFAVIHPDTRYGRTMKGAFERQVRAQGGETVATVAYPQDATSFGKALEPLRGRRFDGLFVADSARRLALVAPALAAAGLWSHPADAEPPKEGRPITLLAPSVGYSRELVEGTHRYLQGALFAHPFHPESATGPGREFADAFAERYGSEPDTFAVYAYDAFRLVRSAVEEGAADRQELAERLGSARNVATAGPSRGFSPGREPARGPQVLELRGTSLSPVQVPKPPRRSAPQSRLEGEGARRLTAARTPQPPR